MPGDEEPRQDREEAEDQGEVARFLEEAGVEPMPEEFRTPKDQTLIIIGRVIPSSLPPRRDRRGG